MNLLQHGGIQTEAEKSLIKKFLIALLGVTGDLGGCAKTSITPPTSSVGSEINGASPLGIDGTALPRPVRDFAGASEVVIEIL
ncbi:hypothetical protein [Burkholderia orbicola]|uniref:hypothetical protein n=1 Tax=Burkholderia orbicola TaxID=2978683 RepID=UPI002FE27D4C